MTGAITNRIKEFRQAKGWTTRQLADAIGASQGAVSRIETGKMKLSLPWLEKIAFVLGIRVIDLLDDPGDFTYAYVRGNYLVNNGTPMFLPEQVYSIPVPPLTSFPVGSILDAFETSGGSFVVAQPVTTLKHPMIGKVFILLLRTFDWDELEFRTLEESASGPGFSTREGDPSRRWIGWDDGEIFLRWLIIAEWKVRN